MKSWHLLFFFLLFAAGSPDSIAAHAASRNPGPGHRAHGKRGTSRRGKALSRKGRRHGGDREPASAKGPFVVHLDEFGEPAGARVIGTANLSASRSSLSAFRKTYPEGGLYHIIVRVFQPNSEEDVAGQLRLASRAGMRTLLTLVGTPWDQASVKDKTLAPGGLPAFARSAPLDPGLWAEEAARKVREASASAGVRADYLEIWNEPDRAEFWNGSREEFLDLFQAAAFRLEEEFGPQGIRVGGPGQAGAGFRTHKGQESILLSLPRLAAEEGMPLDFLSWHHYIFSGGLRYHQTLAKLRERMDAFGLDRVALLVSEWNVTPTPGGARGVLLDGPAAAAQYAGFISSAADLGLDGQAFFMLQDVSDPLEVQDFQGLGLGALTQHGVKKPVYRIMEFMNLMAREVPVKVDYPEGEWEASVWGTRTGDRVRLVIGNAPLDPEWVWIHASRERGADAGLLAAAVHAAGYRTGGNPPSIKKLMRKGLSEEEAGIALEVLALTLEAREKKHNPLSLEIRLDTAGIPEVGPVWRFDSDHNDPAPRREAILPALMELEAAARGVAAEALTDFLADQDIQVPADPEHLSSASYRSWVMENGIDPDLAHQGWDLYLNTLRKQQTSRIEWINSLPETSLQSETASQAGIILDQDGLNLSIQPDSVLVLDLFL